MKFIVLLLAAFFLVLPQTPVPDDLESSYQALKEAESKKDVAQVKMLAAATSVLAHQVIDTAAPADDDEKQIWTTRVGRARVIDLYTEYALFVTAIQAGPADTVDLLAALEKQNPKSRYLDDSYGSYFVALQQTKAASRVPAVAEEAVTHFPENEDLLLVLADHGYSSKQPDRASRYAERLIAVLNRHPKPEGLSAAAWERKRTAALGRAYWIAGVVHAQKNQNADADKDLRAALPLVQNDPAMKAAALFQLGLVNYQIGKLFLNKKQVQEAASFSEQAGAIPGPFAAQARHNALVMRNEAIRMR